MFRKQEAGEKNYELYALVMKVKDRIALGQISKWKWHTYIAKVCQCVWMGSRLLSLDVSYDPVWGMMDQTVIQVLALHIAAVKLVNS